MIYGLRSLMNPVPIVRRVTRISSNEFGVSLANADRSIRNSPPSALTCVSLNHFSIAYASVHTNAESSDGTDGHVPPGGVQSPGILNSNGEASKTGRTTLGTASESLI